MKTHDLKCWRPYFEHVLDGRKKFEVRRNDRDYKVGDILRLLEYVPVHEALTVGQHDAYYTGLECRRRITYVYWPRPGKDAYCGMENDVVVLGLEVT